MKLLISAYACEPHKGSEPEVGWRWTLEKAKEFKSVTVVTRKNNQQNIENELKKLNVDNIRFLYYDLPKWASFWKKGGRGVQLYAYLWEIFVFIFLLRKFRKNEFDVAHRVTFVSYRFPSFIWYFGKKFIFGPIAGGERYPFDFLKIFSFKGKTRELIRTIIQRISLFDPLVLLTLYKADHIIAVTEDTKSILPKLFQKKTSIKPAISIDTNDFNIFQINDKQIKNENIRLLYVGNLFELKGLMLSLMSLRNLDKSQYEFNIIGDGKDKKIFVEYVGKYNLNVNFLGKKDRNELSQYYLSHDLFVFPSLHDSGGMVVLEAKAHGLKVVTSSFGGPKMFCDQDDYIIESKTVDDFVKNLTRIILEHK